MIPAHNEESVISNTVETVLQMDYQILKSLLLMTEVQIIQHLLSRI